MTIRDSQIEIIDCACPQCEVEICTENRSLTSVHSINGRSKSRFPWGSWRLNGRSRSPFLVRAASTFTDVCVSGQTPEVSWQTGRAG